MPQSWLLKFNHQVVTTTLILFRCIWWYQNYVGYRRSLSKTISMYFLFKPIFKVYVQFDVQLCFLFFYLLVPPTILGCPADRREVTAFDATTTQVFWTEPTASSSLGGNVRVNRSHAPGDMFGFGETTVTYMFTDENSGETSVCTFLVIVSRGG